MTINEKIWALIDERGYIDNPHCLGVLFYGSYLTGIYNNNSDIDLHILFDNDDPNHLIRGNRYIDGTRIEYFEKPIGDIYLSIDNEFKNQSNAVLSIFGKSKIIYAKDNQLHDLQEYALEKFSKPLPPLNIDAAMEQVAILNNRMAKLDAYQQENNPYFNHLYHLTIEKIRVFYQKLVAFPSVETAKAYRIYTDAEYRKAFSIDNNLDEYFISLYFKAILDNNLTIQEKYQLLNKMYEYVKKDIDLDNDNYRIPVKSNGTRIDNITLPDTISSTCEKEIPNDTLKIVLKFIQEMKYYNDRHSLGVIAFGRSLTGYNTNNSDIDLYVIFDNEMNHVIRGCKTIDGVRVEYFERPINEVYSKINYEYNDINNALLSIIGNGSIICDTNNILHALREYTRNVFNNPLPKMDLEAAKEQVSIVDNKMEKLEKLAYENNPCFDNYYHIVLERIRKFYHKLEGISKIQTSKVYRIYTDKDYRESMNKEIPEEEFVNMYLALITDKIQDRVESFNRLKEYYNYVTRDINLGKEYQIHIGSRNISSIKPYIKTHSIKRDN